MLLDMSYHKTRTMYHKQATYPVTCVLHGWRLAKKMAHILILHGNTIDNVRLIW